MKVAAIHFGKTADIDANENTLINLNIQAATEYQAKLIVNPEQSILPLSPDSPILVNSKADDVASSRAYAREFAFERGPQMVERFVNEVADRYERYVVVSLITADPQHHIFFNSALLLGPRTEAHPDGVYHTYHKSMLYGDVYAVKGASPLQPANLDIGKIGVMICADYSLPLIARSLVLNGSELIVIPAALTSATLDTLKARAIENCVPLVLANCFQTGMAGPYFPESAIVNGNEEYATSQPENRLLICDIDCDNQEVISRRDRILTRRHPDLYEGVLVDLTSEVLRTDCPAVTEPEVTIVTISEKETFQSNNFLLALADIRTFARHGPVIVVLPEFPLEMPAIKEHLNHLREYKVYVACGVIESPNMLVCLFDPDGKELMRYKKVHLSGLDEENGIQSGNRLEFYLDLPMGRVAVLSGEDLLYPEAIETLRNCAVDLILAPANVSRSVQVLFKDIAHSRHINLAVADYESDGGIYRRSPYFDVADESTINSLQFNLQKGKIEPAKGLPAIPLVGGETIVRR